MNDRWSQLSMSEKSDLMSLYIRNGISSLEEIKKHYNSYQVGGPVSKKTPNFVQRFNEGNKRDIPFQGGHATHLLSYAEKDGKYYVYPEVQPTDYNNSNSPLQYYGRDWRVAFDRAYDNNDYLEFDTEEAARNYSENYKKIPSTGAVLNGRNRGNYNILDYMRGYATGGHLYQVGGPEDPPSWYKSIIVAGTTPETSDNTSYYHTPTKRQKLVAKTINKGNTKITNKTLTDTAKETTNIEPVISDGGYSEGSSNYRNWLLKQNSPVGEFNIPTLFRNLFIGNDANGEENEYWKAYLGQENKLKPARKEDIYVSDYLLNTENDKSNSDYYGITDKIRYNLEPIFDTTTSNKLLKEWTYNTESPAYKYLSRANQVGKHVMQNPYKWHSVNFDLMSGIETKENHNTNEYNPLGMFGTAAVLWDPDEEKAYIRDTYDFTKFPYNIVIPQRPRTMNIRGSVYVPQGVQAEAYYNFPIKGLMTESKRLGENLIIK